MDVSPTRHRADERRIETWIFDLDNTLYPPSARLFDQISQRMSAFICREIGLSPVEADRLRDALWERYGTTMAGLHAEFGIAAEAFLHESHEIDLSALRPDPALVRAINALPGRRIIHTNGPKAHAERVLAARGLSDAFDDVFSIEDTGLISKPDAAAYDLIAEKIDLRPDRAAMIEDSAANLRVPNALGMTTILVHNDERQDDFDHVDHHIADLTLFLERFDQVFRAV